MAFPVPMTRKDRPLSHVMNDATTCDIERGEPGKSNKHASEHRHSLKRYTGHTAVTAVECSVVPRRRRYGATCRDFHVPATRGKKGRE